MSGGQGLGPQFVRRWVGRTADGVHDQRDFLTQLDAAIGDADHGVNMDRGLSAAIAKLDSSADDGTGQILETVGSTLAPGELFGFGRVIGLAFVIAVVQVVLTTAFATLLASLYNLAAYFVGGLQVVLTED